MSRCCHKQYHNCHAFVNGPTLWKTNTPKTLISAETRVNQANWKIRKSLVPIWSARACKCACMSFAGMDANFNQGTAYRSLPADIVKWHELPEQLKNLDSTESVAEMFDSTESSKRFGYFCCPCNARECCTLRKKWTRPQSLQTALDVGALEPGHVGQMQMLCMSVQGRCVWFACKKTSYIN